MVYGAEARWHNTDIVSCRMGTLLVALQRRTKSANDFGALGRKARKNQRFCALPPCPHLALLVPRLYFASPGQCFPVTFNVTAFAPCSESLPSRRARTAMGWFIASTQGSA
jgi:hypothetical protein